MNTSIMHDSRPWTTLLENPTEQATSEWFAWPNLAGKASVARGETVSQDTLTALEVCLGRAPWHSSDLLGLWTSWTQTMRSYSSIVQIEQQIENMLLSVQNEGVVLPHSDAVANYVREHSDMSVAVEIIATTCRSRFGKDASLLLDVRHDPEEKYSYLFLGVRVSSYGSDFMSLVDEVGALADAVLGRNAELLLVSTDFAPIE